MKKIMIIIVAFICIFFISIAGELKFLTHELTEYGNIWGEMGMEDWFG